MGDAFPDFRDYSRRLEARHEGRTRHGRIVPLACHEVGEVDPRRFDFDQNLAFAWFRRRLFNKLQCLRPTEVSYFNRFHTFLLLLGLDLPGQSFAPVEKSAGGTILK